MNQPPAPNPNQPPAPGSGFDANRPTIISLLYLGSFVTGITGLVGIVLAHVWNGEDNPAWMKSHYSYLIRTFWIGFAAIDAGVLTVVVIGMLLFPLIAVWVGVRSVMSLIKAQRQEPMPDPETLLF
ncbi:MAG: hypothetical protein AAGK02_10085 [Pseudomonadota bacterium]